MTDQFRTGGDLFLGIDSSTQGLKSVVIDEALDVVCEHAVNFDRDLPEFGTEGGAHRHADGLTVTAPALMWVAALDLLLERMRADDCPFAAIAAVSGSGQQHGSVWLRSDTDAALSLLDAARTLRQQLDGIFALPDSPIWMDASTSRECAAREDALGGAQAVAELTGSRAFERFTGNQIAKIYRERPDVYAATHSISLVSSFMASLLAGRVAPIDASDGSGMNIMDLRSKTWNAAALDCTAPELIPKLGDIVASHEDVGSIHPYFARRYGFTPDCLVVAFSGDNPNSLAGLRLQTPGDIAVSLGTSDTVFGFLSEPRPSATEGHVFANPVDPDAYMAMIVHQNGSLTREQVRDTCTDASWDGFSRALRDTSPGNDGRIGIYITEPEITPPILTPGISRFDAAGDAVDSFPPGADVRALVEGQFLSLRLHGANIGLRPTRILATGGASANREILQVMADVFSAPVFVGEQANSAALGAAYRAMHGWRCRREKAFVPFARVFAGESPLRCAADPDPGASALYDEMVERFRVIEEKVARG